MSGILLCGLNGSGKSTVGKALAQRLGWEFLDIEDCFFPKDDSDYLYRHPRSREEAGAMLLQRVQQTEHFVLAAVKADYGQEVTDLLTLAVWLQADPHTRAKRVRRRSYEKFGFRMLPGGDLHQVEESFFTFCDGRDDREVETWLSSLTCPVIQLDGTGPVQDTVDRVIQEING
ncbi:MAG: AAA family ATPase [Acutalibacter sp.]|jgi:gluconate kinase